MRELKGDWRDLFNGFMIALDLRKMFLAFCGIIFTVFGIGAVTAIIGNAIDADYVRRPSGFLLHEIYGTVTQAWHVIYTGTAAHPADWKIYLPYSVFCVLALISIWSYFGGAICRIAAYEIAKDGERIETARALKFSGKKFWSFFWAPLICAIGFAFFFLCNFLGGLIGKLLDIIPYAGVIGAPLVSLLLPLAVLSGFIMLLIAIGTVTGSPLFLPAVAAEGTDSFDAVSRGFSYVYSRPWHYLWYQGVSAAYGYVCIAFVILFAIGMSHLGIKAGAAGFDLFGVWDRDQFDHVADASWGMILSKEHARKGAYRWDAEALVRDPHPYGRIQFVAGYCIVRPDWTRTVQNAGAGLSVSTKREQRTRELEKALASMRQELLRARDAAARKQILVRLEKFGLGAKTDRHYTVAGNALILLDQQDPRNKAAETHLKELGYLSKTVGGKRRWGLEKPREKVKGDDGFVTPAATNPWGHRIAVYVVTAWLIIILGMALGYPISYALSQQTLIYFILRKKVDGIEMNEVFEEAEEEDRSFESPPLPPKPEEEVKPDVSTPEPPPSGEGSSEVGKGDE